jgi:hypothetical protein
MNDRSYIIIIMEQISLRFLVLGARPTRLALALAKLAPPTTARGHRTLRRRAPHVADAPDGYLGFRGGQEGERALVDYARSMGIAVP